MTDCKMPPEFRIRLRHIAKKTAVFIIAILLIISYISPVSAGEEDGQDKAVVNDYMWLWGMPAGYKGDFGIGITGRNLGRISNGEFKFELVDKDASDNVIAVNVDENGSLMAPGYWGDDTLLWINLKVSAAYTGTGLPAGDYRLRITPPGGDPGNVVMDIDGYFTVYSVPFVKYDVGPNAPPSVGPPYYPAGAENYSVNIIGANFLNMDPANVSVELTDWNETWIADSVSIEPAGDPLSPWDSLIAAQFSKPLPSSPVELYVIVKVNGAEAPCTTRLDTLKVALKPVINDYMWLWGMPSGYKGDFGIGITGQSLDWIKDNGFKFELVDKSDPNTIVATNDDGNGSLTAPGYWDDKTRLWLNLHVCDTVNGLPDGEYVLRVTAPIGNSIWDPELGMRINGYFGVYSQPFVKYDLGPNAPPDVGPAEYPVGAQEYTVNIKGAKFTGIDPSTISVKLTDGTGEWPADSVSVEQTEDPVWDSVIVAQFSSTPLPSGSAGLHAVVRINGVDVPCTDKLDTVKVIVPALGGTVSISGTAKYGNTLSVDLSGTANSSGALTQPLTE